MLNNSKYKELWAVDVDNFKDAVNVYSNFITPPDMVSDEKHTVLLVDVHQDEVDCLAAWCRTADLEYNIYLYTCVMTVSEWFGQVAEQADAIIVNTALTTLTPIKDKLAELPVTWYYGPKNFLTNNQSIKTPVDYFINYEKSVK